MTAERAESADGFSMFDEWIKRSFTYVLQSLLCKSIKLNLS